MAVGRRLALVLLTATATAAAPAVAQEPHQIGASAGGRASNSAARLGGQDLADSLALACQVVDAAALGRGEDGAAQFEIACADGRGFRLIGGAGARAVDCLELASQRGPRAPGCRLGQNRDSAAAVAALARQAGLDCPVDEGAMLGLTTDGARLYEVGCRGVAGARLEQAPAGWRTTGCLTLAARGDACRFTTEAELLATLAGPLAAADASGCRPTRLRPMGLSASGPVLEVGCDGGRDGLIIRLDDAERVTEALACADAAHIGGGCTLIRPPRP